MRIAGIIAVGLLFVATPAAAADDGWVTFHDPDGVFQIEMPQEPVVATRLSPAPDGKQSREVRYLVERGGGMMLVLVGDYVGSADAPGAALDRVVTALQSHGRRLLSDISVTVDGHAGRDVVLALDKGGTLKDRLFFVDNRVYQAFAGLPADPSPDQTGAAERYSNSLHFLK